ncbi:antitoxin component YwqK of YwqJK toxin-antitoxin module [Algoriphagus boseongensis]|uniref:Antitoxin component YwqK of YwqJK toxin-antitoxin module n=1 Tax=Algoriphagus boseongensis TaxID=1442587 RepID=A0A4R6T8Q9_9BACT|nr:toxin-antitoxin system YwqK family antitoxin [Algoriphagus boseongensis]TDQ17655.1 antitoxin component YwqK of YwqJK toxin-antitoxin module [Algoriphagus boseongensis]
MKAWVLILPRLLYFVANQTIFLMFTLVFILLSVFSPTQALDSAYFYFGNTNVIGLGLISDGTKTGEWKVYSKTNPDPYPKNSLEQADPEEFYKKFNQEFPSFILHFEKGIPNGPFLENYPNGKPKVIANLKDGVFEGEFGEFYEGGELRLRGKVLDGKKEGEWQEFTESGKIISSMTYRKGSAEGKGIGYYDDGNLEWEGNFKNGELDGTYIYLLPDSTLKTKGQYANGIPVGEWIEKLEILPGFYRKGTYKNGFKEGEWQLTNSEGEYLQTEYYQEGKLLSVGEFQTPNPIEDKSKVKNGKGQRYFYDEKGNILARGKIVKGKKNGLWYFYFPESDRVSAAGRLQGSDRIGNWNFYTYNGDVKEQIQYFPKQDTYMTKGNNTSNNYRTTHLNSSQMFNRFESMQGNISSMGQFLR